MRRYHLAQLNIGRFRAPLEEPMMEGFRSALDPINALADQAPGFVWRLQTEEGNATAIRPYAGDDLMAVNMSVWESLESLQQFVYKSRHLESLRGAEAVVRAARGPDPGVVVDTGGTDSDRCRGTGAAAASQGSRPDGTRLHVPHPISGAR